MSRFPMPIRHVPFWLDRVSKARRPSYERFTGTRETTVVDRRRRADGLRLRVLLRRGRVEGDPARGRSGWGGGNGRVARAGARGLRRVVHRNRLTRTGCGRRGRCGSSCGARRSISRRRSAGSMRAATWHRSTSSTFTRRDAESSRRLRREYQARRDAGLEHSWLTTAAIAREAALDSGGGIRTRGVTFDPYRACLALARPAPSSAARRSSSTRRCGAIRAGRKQVELTLERGTIRGGRGRHRDRRADPGSACAAPPPRGAAQLRRRHRPAARGRPARAVGRRDAALRDSAHPPHVLRWLKDDRVLFAGAAQPDVPARRARRRSCSGRGS